ncbi:ricin-type beta-trefoil lectin domain protein [Streptomyces sp. NBC_01012]|uniref:ricin-type beta-trefoil lectin domain protein n=1 Tax=Streptomyces sp. NBC_01012 TaxID=2903717 RepID=UPI00386D12B4|nr:ricin-type beta-trefoil lectin domain protein [Streptomyces sp. NBC_01012]
MTGVPNLSFVFGGPETANGTPVELWDCHGGDSRKWTCTDSAGALVNSASGRCPGIPDAGTDDGIQPAIRDCDGAQVQQWILSS